MITGSYQVVNEHIMSDLSRVCYSSSGHAADIPHWQTSAASAGATAGVREPRCIVFREAEIDGGHQDSRAD